MARGIVGANSNSRLRGGEYEKFDEIINNHDILLKNYRKIFVYKYGTDQHDIPPFKWQKSYHDHIIRNENDFQNHYQYIVYNHQKHGLSEDYYVI